MPSWKNIIGGDVSFSEKLNETWGRWTGGSSDDEDSDDSADSEREPSDEWWYGDAPALKWPKPEPIRMAPMQSADEAETIAVKMFHDGCPEAAEVLAVYAEFALRDAWGDRYHIDVGWEEDAINGVTSADDWFEWVDENPDTTAKDANIMVIEDAGWRMIGGGDTGTCQRGRDIAELYGETLFVDGSTSGHDEASTGMHELLHCLGFSHGDGGKIGSAITPMGHYANTGDTYSFRLHPDVQSMTPDVQ